MLQAYFEIHVPSPTRLQFSLPGAPSTVELRGEIDDWATGRQPTLVRNDDSGATFASDLDLPPGVYAYKLRVDRTWLLDPGNPRTRCMGENQNNVIVVGGTPEPLLFAPGLPFLAPHPLGGQVLTVLLRKGHGDSLRVVWSEGREDTQALTPMIRAGEEHEHLVFRLHLPTSTANATFRFLLDDQTLVGQSAEGLPFSIPKGSDPLPSWWQNAVIYTVFVDRFRPAEDHPSWTQDPGPDRPAGGHLDGVTRSMGHLTDLGVTVLHLTPVHRAMSCHRYDVIDPMEVDPSLGGEAALKRLLVAAHDRGLRVLLDFSLLHAGEGFPAYEAVRRDGPDSPFASWFQWREKRGRRVLKHYGGRRDAPLLDLGNPEVQELVVRTARVWAERGIDGFRLDAVAQVPIALGKRVRDALRDHVPDGVVYGEIVPEHAWRWHEAGVVDVATDFSFQGVMTAFLAERSIDARVAADRIATSVHTGGLPGARAVRFLSTHDHNRFATLCSVRGDPNRTALGMLLLAAAPGTPMLVYGEELGLAADVAGLRPEGVWEDRPPMPWDWSERHVAFRTLTRTLLQARRAHPALQHGDLQLMFAEDRLLVARRAFGNDILDIVVNASDAPVELDLDDDWLEVLEPIVTTGEVRVRGQHVSLGPNAGLLAHREPRPHVAGVEEPRARVQRQARDEAFATGSPFVPTRPTRIDFSLTERCNLRCRHCINHSPDRTCQRSARTLTHAVLERIREDFAHASYFGFVHGGESLAAPILFDVLDAIRFARAGAPAVVHLLSNGMLLTPRNATRLVDAGVSSISVSIDGATAKTNDSIREGSRLETIVGHVRAITAMRRERQLDVRVGISCVVTSENLPELSALTQLAADMGVDWVKLEELVPSTEQARAMRVDERASHVREAIEAAMGAGRSRGLVMVDHTNPPRVWRCRLEESPDMASFLDADQFANRSEIHPCRAAWEQVCLDPNGDVRVASFHGPVLGNVMAEPLVALWNGTVARSERARSRVEWVCGVGPVTCLE